MVKYILYYLHILIFVLTILLIILFYIKNKYLKLCKNIL